MLVKPVHVKLLGPIHASTAEQRSKWLGDVFCLGESVDEAFRTSLAVRFRAWLSLARLQFYPFPLLVLTTGALSRAASSGLPVLALTFMLWFALEPLVAFGAAMVR